MRKPEGAPPLFLEAWLALLTAHSRLIPLVSRDLEKDCGISLAWYDVLFQVSVAADARLRMHELATAVLLSQSGLTRLVDRMESAGLVKRTAIAGDRRSLHVQVTPAGRKLVERARRVVRQSVERHFASNLGERELATIRDSLARVAGAATEGRESATRRS